MIKEINGYDVATGKPVSSFDELRNDGSTACGCWIYSGIYKDGVNQARRRNPGDISAPGGIVSPEWAWAWPANRRILYNRASADLQGKPWSERKRYVWWDEHEQKWTGYDVPDFPATKRPDYQRAGGCQRYGRDLRLGPVHHDGGRSRGGCSRPVACSTGRCRRTTSRSSRRCPTCSIRRSTATRPMIRWRRPENPYHVAGDPRYPLVATTFRLTEHHTAGGMSRTVPWLVELQPEMFAEIDPVLAADRGIEDGGWMTIVTERAPRSRRVPR